MIKAEVSGDGSGPMSAGGSGTWFSLVLLLWALLRGLSLALTHTPPQCLVRY